jgi:hypothetical protein
MERRAIIVNKKYSTLCRLLTKVMAGAAFGFDCTNRQTNKTNNLNNQQLYVLIYGNTQERY